MASGLDIGPIFDLAAGVLESIIRTCGTVVDLSRPGVVTTVDPDTLAATEPASTSLGTLVPALIVPGASAPQGRPYPGTPISQVPIWTVILLPGVTDLLRGDHVTVTASRDGRLLGGVFELTVMLDNSAGAARIAHAARVPVSGQT